MSPTAHRIETLILPTAASEADIASLLARIVNEDPAIRTEAWVGAGEMGAAAVEPLADLMSHSNSEAARAAKRGVWKIVRHSSRPGAESECTEVAAALVRILESEGKGAPLKVEILRMLSEIGGDSSVKAIAAKLSDPELREDARMALERIPGERSMTALTQAFVSVPEDFRPAIVRSLRNRGVQIEGQPELKRLPSRATRVVAE